MNGQPDHVWSLMAGSLYMPGVKKGVKRAEQMEEERETETEWADGEVLGRKELFSTERCEDITVQRKGKKISTSEKIEGGNTTIENYKTGYKAEMQRHGWQ